jgi:hypothetical protein
VRGGADTDLRVRSRRRGGGVVISLRIMLRANADRIGVVAAAAVLGASAGLALLYLALVFSSDRGVDF